jgi:hypothetical protein
MRAIVVFHGAGIGAWSRFLKPGFRHCFVATECDGYWIVFDPQKGSPKISIVAPANYDLRSFYLNCGFHAVETKVKNKIFWSLLLPATCVAAVKRILGLKKVSIWTPHQLYQFLI